MTSSRHPALKPTSLLAFAHDVVAAGVAWLLAYWLRFNLDLPELHVNTLLVAVVVAVPVQALFFQLFGLYRGVWRYASIPDLRRILLAVASGTAFGAFALTFIALSPVVPRSVYVLQPLLLLIAMGGSRLAVRLWREHKQFGATQSQGTPVLVIGTGDAAVMLVKELARSTDWRVSGLLSDDEALIDRAVQGVPVYGPHARLSEVAARLAVSHAILAVPEARPRARRRLVEACREAKLNILTVPSFDDLMSGKVQVSAIRKVELDDLLGRDPVQLDDVGLTGLIKGHTVLVTGAGGSIGTELTRQILRFSPRSLVLVENGEFALYNIMEELGGRSDRTELHAVIADVRDRARMHSVMHAHRPNVVFHAAAYKHVPLMENSNAAEALANNVLGTVAVGEAAIAMGVAKFVLISTDKAVNPTNVMGASKRLAELACQSLNQRQTTTRFVMVRFGNVLGSNGSVIPKFREQIARGGPITVTHPDIVRYFMSIPEASQLVLQAALMGEGGEIFVLDMGEPVKIVDLARDMIRLSGLAPEEIRIEFTGLRPGEKLFEELLADTEATLATPHEKLRIARPQAVPDDAWRADLEAWIRASLATPDEAVIKQGLRARVPEYTPQAN